jgi:hypothetical protein
VTFGEYLVTGSRRYRGHEPGTTFEAQLERNAEARAIQRGDIRLLRTVEPELPPGAVLPDNWITTNNEGRESGPQS